MLRDAGSIPAASSLVSIQLPQFPAATEFVRRVAVLVGVRLSFGGDYGTFFS
jgi:hypothetical protein